MLRAFIFIMICCVAGCAPYLNEPKSLGIIKTWSSYLGVGIGEIQITANLKQNSQAYIKLISADEPEIFQVKISLSDKGCDIGHKVVIEYYSTKNTITSKYFKKPIPWGTDFTMAIDLADEYAVILGDEKIKFKPFKRAKYIYLDGSNSDFNIVSYQYSKFDDK